jgi:excisionase family DNA binding protein
MENTKYQKETMKYFADQEIKNFLRTSEIITPHEASQILRIEKAKVMELINLGVIKAVKSTKGVKIYKKSVSEFIAKIFDSNYPNNFNDDRVTIIFKPFY